MKKKALLNILTTAFTVYVFCGVLFAGAYDEAKKLAEANKYEEAVKVLDKELEKSPEDIFLRNMRGSIHVDKLKTPEKALDDFNFLISISEKKKDLFNAAIGYHNRGNAYYGMGMYEEAVDDHSRAIVLRDYFGYYYNRAAAYDKLGRLDDSIKDMTSAIALKPDHSGSYLLRANYYAKNKEFVLAARDLEKALSDMKDKTAAHYNIVETYIYLKDFKTALEYLKEYAAYKKDAYIYTDDYELWNKLLENTSEEAENTVLEIKKLMDTLEKKERT